MKVHIAIWQSMQLTKLQTQKHINSNWNFWYLWKCWDGCCSCRKSDGENTFCHKSIKATNSSEARTLLWVYCRTKVVFRSHLSKSTWNMIFLVTSGQKCKRNICDKEQHHLTWKDMKFSSPQQEGFYSCWELRIFLCSQIKTLTIRHSLVNNNVVI